MKHQRRAIQRLLRKWFGKGSEGNRSPKTDKKAFAKRLATNHSEAAYKMADYPSIRTTAYLNKKIKTRTDGSEPEIIEFYNQLIKELEKRGFPFYAHCFYRSPARQARLYAQGVSKAKPGNSAHNWGCAVDVVHFRRHWDLTKKEWSIIGAIGKEVARKRKIKIVWGGDWKFYDPAHWHLENWRDVRARRLSTETESSAPE